MLATKRYEYLNFDQIKVHPAVNNHRALNAAKVTHLEKDILANGLLEPIVVWERSQNEYFLVGGFHRMEAIREIRKTHAGYFDRVDVRVVAGDPDEIKALNLKLNADRLDTRITDYFETVVHLNNANWPAERIGDFLDKSSTWIEEIIRFAPMITPELKAKLDSGDISWNRVKDILQKMAQAPAGNEKKVIAEELAKSQARVVRPLTFKSVVSHFSEAVKNAPSKPITMSMQDLYSFILLLRGKEYTEKDLKRVKSVFPELLAKDD
jgi:ParB family transcriptional regulator, chromosome partitioning protein